MLVMTRKKNRLLSVGLSVIILALGALGCLRSANQDVILATTTSTRDSGLLDVLLPRFKEMTGYKVKPIAIGSGQALTLGERGEADVLLVHAPAFEKIFMGAGHGTDRRIVMHNDFIIAGPASDPAGIKGTTSAVGAFKKVAEAGAIFISRGDNSGTHLAELKIWKTAETDPEGKPWYQSTGQGMGASLRIAFEKEAYIVTDRATYLANSKTLPTEILVEGDALLLNIYHVIQVNPAKSDRINAAGARAFAEFLVDPETQRIIGDFGVDKFGKPLFFPDAETTDEKLKNS